MYENIFMERTYFMVVYASTPWTRFLPVYVTLFNLVYCCNNITECVLLNQKYTLTYTRTWLCNAVRTRILVVHIYRISYKSHTLT
jgi:hypothetical protein